MAADDAGEIAAEGHEQREPAGPPRGLPAAGRANPSVSASGMGDPASALLAVQTRYEQLHEAIGRADLKASVAATSEGALSSGWSGGAHVILALIPPDATQPYWSALVGRPV